MDIIKKFDEKFVSPIPSKKKAFWCEEPIVEDIKSFILSEMTTLMKECESEIETHRKKFEIVDDPELKEMQIGVQKGLKYSKEILKTISAKHGIKI